MSDDAIQDLIAVCRVCAVGRDLDTDNDRLQRLRAEMATRAQAQHTANRDVIASLRSSLEGRAVEVELLKAELERMIQKFGALQHAEQARVVEVGRLQAKVARLETAIADHVIEEAANAG